MRRITKKGVQGSVFLTRARLPRKGNWWSEMIRQKATTVMRLAERASSVPVCVCVRVDAVCPQRALSNQLLPL